MTSSTTRRTLALITALGLAGTLSSAPAHAQALHTDNPPQPAASTSDPAALATAYLILDDGVHNEQCTGALVAPQWVLTAQHCYHRDTWTTAGNRSTVEIPTLGASATFHPVDVIPSSTADLLLVQLDKPATVAPLALNGHNLFVGDTGTANLWNGTNLGPTGPSEHALHTASATMQRRVVIRDEGYRFPNSPLIKGVVHAGRIYPGDSGSPLIVDGTLAGIMSTSDQEAPVGPGEHGLWVPVAEHLRWIAGTTGAKQPQQTGPVMPAQIDGGYEAISDVPDSADEAPSTPARAPEPEAPAPVGPAEPEPVAPATSTTTVTVTTTQPAPAPKTVTVTKTEPAPAPETVTVTKTEPAPAPETVTVTKTEPAPAPKTVTVTKTEPAPAPKTVTTTKTAPAPAPVTVTTTVTAKPVVTTKTTTVTKEVPAKPVTVTVTATPATKTVTEKAPAPKPVTVTTTVTKQAPAPAPITTTVTKQAPAPAPKTTTVTVTKDRPAVTTTKTVAARPVTTTVTTTREVIKQAPAPAPKTTTVTVTKDRPVAAAPVTVTVTKDRPVAAAPVTVEAAPKTVTKTVTTPAQRATGSAEGAGGSSSGSSTVSWLLPVTIILAALAWLRTFGQQGFAGWHI